MSTQPEALRLADALDVVWAGGIAPEAAAELRRLSAEWYRLSSDIDLISAQADSDTALLRQALYALEIYGAQSPDVHQTITALRERLGEKK